MEITIQIGTIFIINLFFFVQRRKYEYSTTKKKIKTSRTFISRIIIFII